MVNKIFGIGFSKTGTTSLGIALTRLGFPTIDCPYDPTTLHELERGEFRLSILQQYTAVTDTPVSIYFAQLDQLFPGSKFILTVRDKESWLRSVEEHWKFSAEWAKRDEPFRRFSYFIHAATYGTYEFNRDRYSFVYDQHTRNVTEYFQNRPHDLLVLDICRGEGYEKLCPFLERPVLNQPFPRANARQEKAQHRAWLQQVDRAVDGLAKVIRRGAKILLLDEGQLTGTPLTTRWKAIPFPERHGEYAGLPRDDIDAINEIQRLVRQHEPDYMVVAWPGLWWLDHYRGLASWLQTFPGTCQDADFVVVDLRGVGQFQRDAASGGKTMNSVTALESVLPRP